MSAGRTLAALLFVVGAAACGDDAPTDGPDAGPIVCTTPRAQRYLPLEVGATWTYRVTPLVGTPVDKSTTVEALEDVGGAKTGITALRVRTAKTDGFTVSWQEDRCTSITRHREQTFDLANVMNVDTIYSPDKIRIDETPAHLAMGASWQVAYTEVTTDSANITTTIAKDETWTVEATAESVTVPSGTYTALRLHKITSGTADKMYWFVAGVGKVKETGDQTEELVSFTLP
ncbi:MAG: hypothetical protein IPL61_05075 [Myxococcales bacterium]|nr:hypothetical protein [Myxococcales bacterium]